MMEEKPITFLIVEDNDLDLEKISRAFSRLEITNRTVRAENGIDGLNVLRGENGRERPKSPCVVLLDLNMPKMNGLEFLQELRSDVRIASTPVFVLTTSDRQKDIDAAYDYGVCGYIVKPIEIAQMLDNLATLDSYLKLSKLPSQGAFRVQ